MPQAGSNAPYRDREWLYQYYVRKRMNLTQIQDILQDKYNITITTQALYNWCKRHDLLKFRGRGRNLKRGTSAVKSPMQKRAEELRKQQRQRQKMKANRKPY